MAKNISLLGADYPDVPAVVLPKTGGGSAMFVDADDVNNVENALAIVVNGDTAPKAITAGQYLFIKNHSTLATGGYHATANIASGGDVSGSNVAADADGISNAINSKFRSGVFNITLSGSAQTIDGSVDFSPAFPSGTVPSVVLTLSDYARGSTTGSPKTSIGMTGSSGSGFTYKVKTDAVVSGTVQCYWMAMIP